MNIKMIVRSLAGSVFISSLLSVSAWAASPTLSVGSASGSAGTSVTLPVAFDPSTASVSSLQFNLTLPAGLSTGAVTAGAVATAAGKTVSASLSGNTWTFVVFGLNQTAISSGTLLTAQLNIAPGTAAGNLSVPISGSVYSDPNGTAIPAGASTDGTVTVTASVAAPVITSAGTTSGTVGAAFSYQIAASNSSTSFNATSLPAGLSVDTGTGLISGTPTTAGTSNVTISATNSAGTGSKTLVLTVNPANTPPPAPVISSALSASATVGTAFSYQITASNSPTSFNATSLPAGLSVNTGTGLISGTPTAAGTYNVTIGAANAGGTGSAILALTVSSGAGGAPTLALGSGSALAGTSVTLPITFNPAAASVASLQFSLTLPAGLSTGTVTSGAILTAAGKSVSTSFSGNTWSFIVFGLNQTPIGGGTLLTVQLNIPLITPGGTLSVPISGTVYVNPSGASIPAGTSAGGTVTVTPATITPPTVAIVPLSTTTVSGTISLTATAFSSVGIAWVQFKLDGNNLGSRLTAAPYAISWNTLQASPGDHALTAVTSDAAGNTTTSPQIFVTVIQAADAAATLRNVYAYPNPAVRQYPVIRVMMGMLSSLEITIFDVSGRVVHSGSVSGTPTGVVNGQYYYDYKWTGSKASGVYFAVIHGKTADGTVIRARTRFAVVQ